MLILVHSDLNSHGIIEYFQKAGEEVGCFNSLDIPDEELKKAEMVIFFGDDTDGLSQLRQRTRSLTGKDDVVMVESTDNLVFNSIMHLIEEERRKRNSLHLMETVKTCTDGLNIFVHYNPDPDAIASAMALEVICREAGVVSKVYYNGDIGYTENETLLECTGFKIEKMTSEDIISLRQEKKDIAFVDFARPGENNKLPEGTVAKIIIDHHYTNKDVTGTGFVDIKSVGATSTLMTEHLQNLNLPVTPYLASALLYGIKVDTRDYTRNIGPADFQAIAYLNGFADSEILPILESVPMDPDTIEALGRAISNRKIENKTMTSFAGHINQRDDIPQVAEILEGERDVFTVLVMGIFQDTIYMSARSKDPKLNLGSIMKRLYDDIGSAGGHQHSAGGNVPLTEFKNEEEAVKELSKKFMDGVNK